MEKFDLFAGASMQLPFDEFTMGIHGHWWISDRFNSFKIYREREIEFKNEIILPTEGVIVRNIIQVLSEKIKKK
jgi:hypothetical protein